MLFATNWVVFKTGWVINIMCLDFSCICYDIVHWMVWKAVLTGSWLGGSFYQTAASSINFSAVNHKGLGFFKIIYTPCYIISDGKGIESVTGKSRWDMKWQIKWTGMPKRLLYRLGKILVRYTVLISRELQYPGAAICRNLYYTRMQHSSKTGRGKVHE